MILRKYALLGLISWVCWLDTIAQSLTREQLTGKWIGVHSEFDKDVFCPLPTYLNLQADSTYHLGMVDGTASSIASTWNFKNGSLRLDTLSYTSALFSVTNDVLRIGRLVPMVFRRFQEVPIDSLSALRMLSGHVWETDSLRLSLFANGQVLWENRHTGQRTVHCWKLGKQGKSTFLITRGNAHTCDGNYKPLWQLVALANRQFRAVGWNGRTVATEAFRFLRSLEPTEVCQTTDFQPCSNCFANLWDPHDFNRSGKLYQVRQIVEQAYQPVHKKGESGLIRFHFAVNCQGQTGWLVQTELDDDYCPKAFDPGISGQLSSICRQRIQPLWSTEIRRGEVRDETVAINIRLKNGAITDIYP